MHAIHKVVYTDGGCSQNGQKDMHKRRMVMVVADDEGVILSETSAQSGSNNIAELMAIFDALEWCKWHGIPAVEIRTDSRIAIGWASGGKVGRTINDRARVVSLLAGIEQLRRDVQTRFVWVPREESVAGRYIEETCSL